MLSSYKGKGSRR